jgi:cytochrome P450
MTGSNTIDLLDLAGYAKTQPFTQLRWLRENDPITWHPESDGGPGFWAITRYADVKTVLGASRVFSSFPSTMIKDTKTLGDGVHQFLLYETYPTHAVHRRSMGAELLPRAVLNFEPHVRTAVNDIINDVIERGECDLVADIAGLLASYVTADWLGLPRDEIVDLYEASDRFNNSMDTTVGEGLEAANQLFGYTQSVWEDRRANPRDDVVTRLAFQKADGEDIDSVQFAFDLLLLINAGGDTTRNVVSSGYVSLIDHPAERERLQADPAMLVTGVEELLRWVSPIVYARRTAVEDATVGDVRIEAGQKIVAFIGSANRDEEQFANGEVFDVSRDPNNHIAFGAGGHFCLGVHLARQELRVMFRELGRRMPDIELAGEVTWLPPGLTTAPVIVGPKTMPVRFAPGPREEG